MTRATWLALAVGIASVTTGACSRPRALTETRDVPTVAVAKVVKGDIAHVLTIAAEFRPFQEIDVHAKVAGFVKSIGVDVGDRVQVGQLLAVLEIPELQDELNQDEAAVKRAREEVHRAQADLARAESAHDVAHLGASRLAAVLKARPNLVAAQDIDEASGRDRIAEAQIATAKAAIASVNEQLEMAKAVLNKTKTVFAYSQITAPFAGVITHRYADTGAMIQAGTSSQTQAMPLVRLSQNNLLRLVIPVPESAVSRIHVGAPVKLGVLALHKTFGGTVARFANRLDTETRTMRVEVDVGNPTLELVPGMYADVSLVLDQAKAVLVAPIQALDRSGPSPKVLVVGGDRRIESRDVEVGLEAADRVEIRSGLTVDELLVIGNRGQLKPGTPVAAKIVAAFSVQEGPR